MACKPTELEIAAIVDAQTLAEWCGFATSAPPATSPPTVPAHVSSPVAFLVGLGLGPTEHYRIVAALSPADYAAYAAAITFNVVPASIKERGAMLFFRQTARRLCLLDDWTSAASLAPLATAASAPNSGGPKLLNLASMQVGTISDQKILPCYWRLTLL